MIAQDLIYLLILLGGLILLLAASELLRRRFHGSEEFSRKFIHILTGILVALSPFFLNHRGPIVAVALVFAVINWISVQKGWLKGMHDLHRRTYGTVYYPLSFVVLALLLWHSHTLILITAMLLLSISDAAAALVGENLSHPHLYHVGPDRKSLEGSAAMFFTSLAITAAALALGGRPAGEVAWFSLLAAAIATVCEALSYQGSDNLTVPLGSALVLHYLLTHSQADAAVFTLGVFMAAVVALLSYRFRFLSTSGATATFLLGTVVFGIGRWPFTVPILTFFILSSLLSKLGGERKKRLSGMIEKGGARDAWQVIANGGLGGLLLVCGYIWPHPVWFLLFAASLAAATADTWGTEIGTLSQRDPRSIVSFKPVPAGTSGGISVIGTLGSAMGSLVLAGVSWLAAPHHSPSLLGGREFLLLFGAGLAASLFDSLLGATLQARFRCPVCHKETEKRHHCGGQATDFTGGLRWMNNDRVNMAAAVFAILVVYALY
ncbi:MAG TPA: DUF92 domain-containing protein [bacterium]|nr:DUF92 domain-containing protein [bacterium]HQJ64212.1 DUF92 domain-containing protein [bacterium]